MTDSVSYIYALLDPRDQAVRYVGKTGVALRRRWQNHMTDIRSQRSHRACWIKHLLSLNLKPQIFLLEEVPTEFWQEAERFWIAHFQKIGARLTNGTTGGDGGFEMSAASRAKISAVQMGRPSANKGKKASAETLARMSAAMKGRPGPNLGRTFSPQWRANMSAARKGNSFRKGKKASAETCARVAKGHLGQPAWNKGKTMSPEYCAKVSAVQKGRRLTPEHRSKIAAGVKLARRARASLEQLPLDL
jgi:hypothetical protein